MKKLFLFIHSLSVSMLLLSANIHAASDNPKTKLQTITQSIADLKDHLVQKQQRLDEVQNQLKKTDISIGHLSLKLRETQQQLVIEQRSLSQLEQQQAQAKAQLLAHQQALIEQLRAAYMTGNHPLLKTLLSPDDINQLGRTLAYYHYLAQYQAKSITDIQKTLNQIIANQQAISQQGQQLAQTRQSLLDQQKRLQGNQTARQQYAQQLHNTIQSNQQKLKQLNDEKAALSNLMERLNAQSSPSLQSVSFVKSKGRFSWPTTGAIIERFGAPIMNSDIRQTGVIIAAPLGQEVHAVADGKVVFANWLSGMGLLAIIDQGNGYMTLYGHNNSLLVKTGEIVRQGEVIATVGQSGGLLKPALYFAIRYHNQPVDPERWCHTA